MRENELMIGDWVLDKYGNSIQVREILGDGINGEWDGGECYGVEAYIDEIKPIPIDLDILEKNGWVRAEDMFVKKPYILIKADKMWGVAYGMAYVAEIRYVHELQNIMRITGYQGGFKTGREKAVEEGYIAGAREQKQLTLEAFDDWLCRNSWITRDEDNRKPLEELRNII